MTADQKENSPVETPSTPEVQLSRPYSREEDFPPEPGDDQHPSTQNMVFTIPVDHLGTNVYIKGWVKEASDKPPIVIVHDLGESIGIYRDAAKRFVDEGYSVFGFDLRGHGRSGRNLGHVPHFQILVKDLLQVVAWIRHKSERRVPIILGQGMGALITIYFQRAHPEMMNAGILIAPVLDNKLRLPIYQRIFIRVFAEFLPRMRLPRTLVPKFITRMPHRQDSSSEIYRGITSNFARELMNAVSEAGIIFKEYSAPSLIISPLDPAKFDVGVLDELLESHEFNNKFTIRSLSSIGIQPLSSKNDELEAVLEEIFAWLNSDYQASKPVA